MRRLHSWLHFRVAGLDAVLLRELDPAEGMLALDDPERAVAPLLFDEVVERTGLVHVLRHVRRERWRHLAALEEPNREFRLLDRRDDTLRLRNELGLSQPTRCLRRVDEPLCVLCTHLVCRLLLEKKNAQLRDCVTRVDALRAALVAEIAARAVP